MSKRTDTNEASQFQGTLTVIASDNPIDYGGGNIELEGSLFTDIIRENTDNIGVDLEGTIFIDNYFTMTPITAPSNPPSGTQRIYIDIADNLLKTRNDTGVVTIYQPLTTKGDLLTHNGTTQVTLPVGANGLYLVTDSSATEGIKWGNISVAHSSLTGLLNDDHTQYSLLAGRTGGQILTGGTASGNNLTLRSTTNATKGQIFIDETTATSSTTTGALRVSGGVGIAGGIFTGTATNLSRTSGVTTIGATTSATISAAGALNIPNTTTSTSSGTGAIRTSGGIGIANVTDAVSATNGGSFTTGGGAAIAKKLFVGTDTRLASTSGVTTIGATTALTISATGVLTVANTTASTSTTTGALIVSGGVGIAGALFATSGTFTTLTAPHSGLTGLTSGDDHTQYALLTGRSGGQILTAGTASGNNLTLRSTTNATKGSILIDETTVSTSTTTGALIVSGGVGISGALFANSGTFTTLTAPHSGLTGLLNDDHTQYALLAGRSGGQILTGGTASGNNLTIRSTTNATKGSILIDETTVTSSTTTGALRVSGGVGIAGGLFTGTGTNLASISGITTIGSSTALTVSAAGVLNVNNTTASTSTTTGALIVSGGVGISNTTDAVSATNGGTITSGGGMGIAKKLFIGTDLSVGGTTLLNNYFQTVNITAPSNPPASNIRFYTDSADSLLKSKNSSGTVTTYQPTTTKGDLQSHNGTTQTRVPVGLNNTYLISDSSQSSGLRWGNLKNVYYVYDLKTTGTNGGSSVAGSWLQRTLNTVVAYPVGTTKVTLSGSNMIFEPGVYKITASTPFSISNADIASRLYDVTNSTVSMISTTSHADSTNAIYYSYIYGIITVTSTTTFRLEYRTDKARASGLGIASGFQQEIYSHLEIELIEYNV